MIKVKVWHPKVLGHYWEGEFETVGEAVEFINKASADIEAAQQGVEPTQKDSGANWKASIADYFGDY